ncbi:hypothetical protein MycrhN_2554 [Mycolicibacterium rhodesiae NBB3]|uniref:Uncharacterized protein n=1 Tax=Mycolicibacterium rhodesiae (strain NBB3) TaxID=710685 RepID=G8RX91_MYCRN|nr:hypothetical protein [Mycolicibacterium rhodesiae]AEV73139.1 hypothetical protein MycrhN_2554 [Mycolicibacterium rhodesiae NBB3]
MPGITDRGSILVNELSDGVRVDDIWVELQNAVTVYNEHKTTVASLLSYPTIQAAAPIAQGLRQEAFERASEHGVPTAMNPTPDVLKLGFQYADWDKSTRFTALALRDMSSEQVTARVSAIMDADARLVQGLVLQRLFDPTPGENDFAHTVYGLWNGDSIVPPRYMGKSFTGSHNHYLVSQGAEIDSGDVEAAMALVTEHGYGLGADSGSQLILLVNAGAEAEAVQSWRAGEENANGQTARFDFIPSSNAPTYLTQSSIVGALPPTDVDGVPVLGSYGKAWVIESMLVPAGYFAVFATGGPNSEQNVIARRMHPSPAWQGLRLIEGNWAKYPLVESFFQRGLGTGVRHRGAASVMQIKASGSYVAPTVNL